MCDLSACSDRLRRRPMQSSSSKGQHDKCIAAGPTSHWPKLTQYRALSCHQQPPTTLAGTSAVCEPKVTHPEHWFPGVVPALTDLGSLSPLLAVHCNSSCQGLCWRSTAAAALLLVNGSAATTAATTAAGRYCHQRFCFQLPPLLLQYCCRNRHCCCCCTAAATVAYKE